MSILKLTLASALGLGAFTGLAQAHATLEQQEAALGATTKITLRIPHGCDGEATQSVRVEIPEGFYAVKPMPKPGWELTTETGAYADPVDTYGTELTEGVRSVTWSDGNLPDAWYDEFTLRGMVGGGLEPGTPMYFPAVQTCANGTAEWTDTSGAQDAPHPAPSLMLVAGEAQGGHGHAGHGHGAQDQHGGTADVQLGPLELSAPFVRATLPNQPVAGGFLTIANSGQSDDRLLSASSPAARRVEIHEMAMEGDVMKMRELAEGLEIPAGETVSLAPGGYHIMFMDLDGPMTEGESFDVTLGFEQAGEVTLTMPVVARDGGPDSGMRAMQDMTHDHGAMSHDDSSE